MLENPGPDDAHDAGRCPDWWEIDAGSIDGPLQRLVGDLLAAELAQARPGRALRAGPWPRDLDFVRDLGVDSLELLGMASALAEALHLRGDGLDQRLLARPRLADWVEAAREGLRVDGSRLSFRTSGSSGSPKRCTHALATLWQEARALARLAPGRRRILSAVPSHHIYGFLFTVLLPCALGADAARAEAADRAGDEVGIEVGDRVAAEVVDLRGASPALVPGLARAGDLVVAHPDWWEALLRLDRQFGPGVVGVTSGAPCADALAAGLAAAGLRLLQVYGSSETGGVGWRDQAGAPFALLPWWRRVEGRADAAAGCADELARSLAGGASAHYPLQDRLAWQDERRFLPAGRIDEAVQVGGVNVFPAYVAEVLRMHPRVLDAAVRAMRPDEGRRLKAFVVARPPADAAEAGAAIVDGAGAADDAALRDELAAWIGARLTPPERPAAFTFGARLPRQASGKPADWIIDAV